MKKKRDRSEEITWCFFERQNILKNGYFVFTSTRKHLRSIGIYLPENLHKQKQKRHNSTNQCDQNFFLQKSFSLQEFHCREKTQNFQEVHYQIVKPAKYINLWRENKIEDSEEKKGKQEHSRSFLLVFLQTLWKMNLKKKEFIRKNDQNHVGEEEKNPKENGERPISIFGNNE